ncbi:hypothetical protein SMICM304S_00757 [Streptomyces microflavus]
MGSSPAPIADFATAVELGVCGGAVSQLLGEGGESQERTAQADPTALLPTGIATAIVHGEEDIVVPLAVSGEAHVERDGDTPARRLLGLTPRGDVGPRTAPRPRPACADACPDRVRGTRLDGRPKVITGAVRELPQGVGCRRTGSPRRPRNTLRPRPAPRNGRPPSARRDRARTSTARRDPVAPSPGAGRGITGLAGAGALNGVTGLGTDHLRRAVFALPLATGGAWSRPCRWSPRTREGATVPQIVLHKKADPT